MITVDTKKLIEAIMEAEAFRLPDMSAGAAHIYDNVCRRLARDEDVRLSHLNFDAFTDDDIDAVVDLHRNVFEKNERTAHNINSALRSIAPAYQPVGFV